MEPNDAASLAQDMLSAIGSQALDATGGDIHRSGQPLMGDPNHPDTGGPPAPAPTEDVPPVPAPEPAQPAEPAAEPAPWFLPGLYKTQDEAIRGIHETKRYASELQDRVRTVQQTVAPEAPAQPVADPLDSLENYGVPKEPFKVAMEGIAKSTIQQIFGPAVAKMQADAAIVAKFPEYQSNFEKLTAYVESQPELNEKITRAERAGEYLLARELAWLNYERSNGVVAQAEMQVRNAERVTKAQEAKADAAVMKPSMAESRTADVIESPNNMSDEKFTDLIALAKSGYQNPLWRATIGTQLAQQYPDVFGKDAR